MLGDDVAQISTLVDIYGGDKDDEAWKRLKEGIIKENKTEVINVHDLKLHESIVVTPWRILRVPGGWVYTSQTGTSDHSIFVPFSREFQKLPKPEPTNKTSGGRIWK